MGFLGMRGRETNASLRRNAIETHTQLYIGNVTLDVKISFRDKSVYRSHGKCDTLTNSKTMLFHAF